MNKMIIDDVEYELILHGQGCTDVPSVMCDGKAYIGQAMQNERKVYYQILGFDDRPSNNRIAEWSDSIKHISYQQWCRRWMDENFSIWKVKRLSDGEIFSIGDRCIERDHKCYIKRFEVEPNRMIVWLCDETSSTPFLGIDLIWVTKLKKTPLFTTEDGVDIYEGDKFVGVQKSTYHILAGCRSQFDKPDQWLIFSTGFKAIEYVTMNKPCLSVNDVINYNGTLLTDRQKSILIELAKEKINATS